MGDRKCLGRILEALVAYYIPALSKHDLKLFSKIKTFLLGFAGCCFFQKFPPEAQLNHETYVFLFQKLPLEAQLSTNPAGGSTKPRNLSYLQQNVKIEIVYTSDTMKLIFHLKEKNTKMSNSKLFTFLTPWNLHSFQKFSPKGSLNHEIYIYFSKFAAGGPTKALKLHMFFKNSRQRLN